MKKILFGMFAATALLLTSCSQDDFQPAQTGDEANVMVTLTTPQIASRAYSDGTTATHLQYAVYEKTGEGAATTYRRLDKYTETRETINISKQINFKLVNGHTYTFVFWAAANNADTNYTVTFGENGAEMKVTYDNFIKANCEDLDAFFVCEDVTVTGDVQKTFELRRPFAQINVGTNDYEEAAEVGYAPTSSRVVITAGIYDTLDLISGEVKGTADKRTFAYNALPDRTKEKFPVDGYDYLAMAYVLVPEDQELVTVQFSYGVAGGTAETRQVGSVPVQRNYRTNLFGSVLTSDVEVNVIIEPAYYDPDYTVDEFVMTAALGGTITMTEPKTVKQDMIFRKDGILNLNGQTLTEDNSTLTVASGANVTINGEGNITKVGMDAFGSTAAVYVNNEKSTLTINGGNITSDGVESVYVQIGTAIIYGGYFAAANDYNGKYYTLNCNDTNYKNKTANIIVYGGTFENFDPSNNNAEGANTNFVAPGYKSLPVTVNGKPCFMVVPEEVDAVVVSQEGLAEAVKQEGSKIMVKAGTYSSLPSSVAKNVDIVCEPGTVFTEKTNGNLNGSSITGATFKNKDVTLTGTINGKFYDCVFDGGFDNVRWCYAGETCYFENCVFEGDVYACHFDGGANPATFKNCTFSGFNAMGGAITLLTYDGCTFKPGRSAYNGINCWGVTVMNDCTWIFEGGKTEWIDAKKELTMKNCTINGVSANDESVADYFTTANYENVKFE